MREVQTSYLHLFVLGNLIIIMTIVMVSLIMCQVQTSLISCRKDLAAGGPFVILILRNIFELKKSFDLKNDCFRTGIVLLSYLFLLRKSGEMLWLELR